MQPRVRELLRFFGRAELLLQVGQPIEVRRRELALLTGQLVAPRVELAALVFEAAALGREHLDLLLHRRDLGALFVAAALCSAHGFVEAREIARLLFGLRREQLALFVGTFDLIGDLLDLAQRFGLALAPLRALHRELDQPLLDARAAFDDIADSFFEAADFERGLCERTLRNMQLVAGRVMRLTDRLELGLAVPQLGHARFERGARLGHGLLDRRFDRRRIAMLQEPQLVQLQLAGRLQRAVLRRDLGLLLELVEVAVQLAQDVFDAGQVLARVLQPVLGLAAAFLVFRNARGLFEKQAQLFGLAFDDPADRALADDRVGTRAEAGAEKHVLHVAPSHRLVVDVVAAAAVASQHALDGDLGEAVPLAAGAAVLVAERELDAGPAGGFAQARAVEDHVLHRLAAQLAGLALAEHPAHRIHDVRLAATVRPDHADELARQLEVGRLGEGFEAGELDRIQAHSEAGWKRLSA